MVNTDRLCLGCMNDNGGEKVCPICGHDSSEDNGAKFLSAGTWLNANRYLVGKVIEMGADGVTYIGWDNDANAVVHIREYFPDSVAVRSGDRMTVNPADGGGLTFNKEMEEFVDLYKKLSQQPESSAILRVVDVFESNGTVYAVWNTISGTSLKAFLIRNGGTLNFEQVKLLFMPLLATITELHQAGIIHRGICPESIIVGRDGKLRLSGFSVKQARLAQGRLNGKLTPGYAAPEQYLENDDCAESCDIYALGAVIFRCLVGAPPPDAKERMVSDKLSIPAKITEIVPKGALVAIANTLKIDKSERTATVDRLRKMLDAVVVIAPIAEDEEPLPDAKKKGEQKKNSIMAFVITAAVLLIVIVGVLLIVFKDSIFISDKSEYVSGSEILSSEESDESESDENESSSVPAETLYTVPNYRGHSFNAVLLDDNLSSKFEIVIAGNEYSDSVPRGFICRQTVDAGKELAKGSEVGVYISLGPSTIKMPNIIGKSKDQAYIKLLEVGFFANNIKFIEKSSNSAASGEVIAVSIEANQRVTINDSVTVYFNPQKVESDPPQQQEPSQDVGSQDGSSQGNSNPETTE